MAYPEHEKLKAIQEQSDAIGAFLDHFKWRGQSPVLAVYHEHTEECYAKGKMGSSRATTCGLRDGDLFPITANIQTMLAHYFKIDLVKLDKEKREMLESIRPKFTPVF